MKELVRRCSTVGAVLLLVQMLLAGVDEASSVTRLGSELVVVTDSDPGAYYTRAVDATDGAAIPLADGRVVALPERLQPPLD